MEILLDLSLLAQVREAVSELMGILFGEIERNLVLQSRYYAAVIPIEIASLGSTRLNLTELC
jgi:hypothetical protein